MPVQISINLFERNYCGIVSWENKGLMSSVIRQIHSRKLWIKCRSTRRLVHSVLVCSIEDPHAHELNMEEASEDTWEESLKTGENFKKIRTISETISRTTLRTILRNTRITGAQLTIWEPYKNIQHFRNHQQNYFRRYFRNYKYKNSQNSLNLRSSDSMDHHWHMDYLSDRLVNPNL